MQSYPKVKRIRDEVLRSAMKEAIKASDTSSPLRESHIEKLNASVDKLTNKKPKGSNQRYISSKIIEVFEREISGKIDERLYRIGKPQEAISVVENFD